MLRVTIFLILLAPALYGPLYAATKPSSGANCYSLARAFSYNHQRLRANFLEEELLFKEFADQSVGNVYQIKSKVKVSYKDSQEQLFKKIEEVEIEKITAKPGHRVLRSVDNIMAIAKAKKGVYYKSDPAKKIIINIITDADGAVKWLDLWDGHHRVLADLVNSAKVVRDLDFSEVEILVDGVLNVNGKKTKPEYIVNIGGVDFTRANQWRPSVDGGPSFEYRPIYGKVDIIPDGSNANSAVGSVTSLGDIFKKLSEERPKVVFFNIDQYKGSESKKQIFARLANKYKEFDQVVLFSQEARTRKELASLLKENHETFPKLNMYTGSDQYWDTIKYYTDHMDGYQEVLQRRLKQIYSTLENVEEVGI